MEAFNSSDLSHRQIIYPLKIDELIEFKLDQLSVLEALNEAYTVFTNCS